MAIVVGASFGTAATSAAAKGGGHRISGDLVVNETAAPGEPCGLPGRASTYADITTGTKIAIEPTGKPTVHAPLGQGVGNADGLCEFPFSARVPDAPRYAIEIADRGTLTFTKRALQRRDWEVLLTLGVPASRRST
ncbi:MAG: hypothetical protein WDA60_16430 [Acidimicrobiia bacterium]